MLFLASDEDKANVNYTDACMVEKNTPCTYCCIVSKGECSRDIRACYPVVVDYREFEYIYIMIGLIVSVVCGIPLLAICLRCCMTVRCFKERYQNTQGVTLMELICRGLCLCVVKFDAIQRKASKQDDIFGASE